MKTLLHIHHIDDRPETAADFLDLAADNGFHLNIVVTGLLPAVMVYGAPGVAGFYYDGLDQEVIESTKERFIEIKKMVGNHEVSASISMECRENASLAPAIQNHALLADMSVFPHGSALKDAPQSETFSGALLGTGQPVLTLGEGALSLPDFKKILFAWNGQVESAKALHHAVRWSADGADIHVTLVDPHETAMGPNPGDGVAGFIARHGLSAVVDRLPMGDRNVSEILIEHANDIAADSVFMGAYGRSRFREWFLGGTTREMLRSCGLPIVMAN